MIPDAPNGWLEFITTGGVAGFSLLANFALVWVVKHQSERLETVQDARLDDHKLATTREVERTSKMIEAQNGLNVIMDQQARMLEKMLERVEAEIRARG